MAIPIVNNEIDWQRVKADDFRWLARHRCKSHGKRYIHHPGCFVAELGHGSMVEHERIGFLDIETTNLSADFGYILSYYILGLDGTIYKRLLTKEEINTFVFDKDLMVQFLKDIQNFDRLIVYYGRDYRFDVPYLRTRALKWGLEFPEYRDYFITDVYDIVKKKFRLHRNRLENICDLLGISSKGHRLNPEVWFRSQAGDEEALAYVAKHNEEDVFSLRDAWLRTKGFTSMQRTSI